MSGQRIRAVAAAAAAVRRALSAALADLFVALGILLRPVRPGRPLASLQGSGAILLVLYLLTLGMGLGYDVYVVGWQGGRLDLFSLPAVSFWALSTLLAAWAVAALAGSPGLALTLAAAGFGLVFWESAADYALAVAADRYELLDRYYDMLSWLPVIWGALAFAAFAASAGAAAASRARRAAVGLLAFILLLAPQWAVNPSARLWASASSVEREQAGPGAPQSEQTFYRQMEMLEDDLDAIEPGEQGATELFTISFAGDATQDVFLNEANGADAVMAEAFGSAGHAVVLANSLSRPQEHPYASASALQRALEVMSERMDPEGDVLVVFLTSHGTPDHHLVVSMPPFDFEDITPQRLREMLDDAGIRYRVVIVSACYAGGFVEALAGDDTMVIAASQADRTSFGCRDGAQWTDFGQAFFPEALAQTASFEGAFRLASQRIAAREAREGLTPSQPQISVGTGIREKLQRLETRRGGRTLFAMHSAARAGARAIR